MYKDFVTIWFEFYRLKTGENYVFDGKDGKHLKQLIKKIERKVIEKGLEPSEENIVNSWRGLLHNINDQWIMDHLEVSIINSKFNVVYSKAARANPFSSFDRISSIVKERNPTRTAQG